MDEIVAFHLKKREKRKKNIQSSRPSISNSFVVLSKPLKSNPILFSLQLLSLCLGVWRAFPGQWHSVSRSSRPLCGNPRVSPSHPEHDYSTKLDGAGCPQPSRPGQYPPAGGSSASEPSPSVLPVINAEVVLCASLPGERCCNSRVRAGAPLIGGSLLWPVNWATSPWTAVYPGHEAEPTDLRHHCHG